MKQFLDNIQFVKPKKKYVQSFWETINTVSLEGKYLATDKRFPYDSTLQFIKTCELNNAPQLFVIDKKMDRCVGWCDVLYKTNSVGVLGVGLLADYREKGIGRRLISAIIQLSIQRGYNIIELDVRRSNLRALHLYETMGFVTYNIISGGYVTKRGTVLEDVVQMTLRIK